MRVPESRHLINGRDEYDRGQGTDTRHGHQPPGPFILARAMAHLIIQLGDLCVQRSEEREGWHNLGSELRRQRDVVHARRKAFRAPRREAESVSPQEGPDVHNPSRSRSDQQLPNTHDRTHVSLRP